MSFFDIIRTSIGNLWRRKLRTFLTVLGVLIGTTSIVAMLSLAIGMRKMILKEYNTSGNAKEISVSADSSSSSTGSDGTSTKLDLSKQLTDANLKVIAQLPHVASVTPVLDYSVTMKSGKYTGYTELLGVAPSVIEQQKLGKGKIPQNAGNTLQVLAGNSVITNFSYMVGQNSMDYYSTGELPKVDIMQDIRMLDYSDDSSDTSGTAQEDTADTSGTTSNTSTTVKNGNTGTTSQNSDSHESSSQNAQSSVNNGSESNTKQTVTGGTQASETDSGAAVEGNTGGSSTTNQSANSSLGTGSSSNTSSDTNSTNSNSTTSNSSNASSETNSSNNASSNTSTTNSSSDSNDSLDTTGGSSSTDTTSSSKKFRVKVTGILKGSVDDYSENSGNLLVNIDQLKAYLIHTYGKAKLPGQPRQNGKPVNGWIYSSFKVTADKMSNVESVQKSIKDLSFEATSNKAELDSVKKTINIIELVMGGIGMVAFIVAAIGIANTMMMSIYERTKEIGVMKVLGCDIHDIQKMFLGEAGFIGLFGGLVGLSFSIGLSSVINSIAAKSGSMTGNISIIPWWLALVAVAFSTLMGMLAGYFPARRAMKLSPLAAIHTE